MLLRPAIRHVCASCAIAKPARVYHNASFTSLRRSATRHLLDIRQACGSIPPVCAIRAHPHSLTDRAGAPCRHRSHLSKRGAFRAQIAKQPLRCSPVCCFSSESIRISGSTSTTVISRSGTIRAISAGRWKRDSADGSRGEWPTTTMSIPNGRNRHFRTFTDPSGI